MHKFFIAFASTSVVLGAAKTLISNAWSWVQMESASSSMPLMLNGCAILYSCAVVWCAYTGICYFNGINTNK